MTQEEVIEIFERFIIGAKPCSQREIVDACTSAYMMLKDQPCEDLEKAAEKAAYNYAKKHAVLGYDYDQVYDAVKYGYEQGWKDQKEQMLKDAVIAETNIIYDTRKDVYRYQLTLPENTKNPYRDCRDWKIIIVKED